MYIIYCLFACAFTSLATISILIATVIYSIRIGRPFIQGFTFKNSKTVFHEFHEKMQIRLLNMLLSFEKCTTLKLKSKNLVLLKPIVIICLTRHLWCHVAA